MLVVHGAGVRVLLVVEAEDQGELVGGDVVAEEPVGRHECYYISVFALPHVHVFPGNAQHDAVLHPQLLRVRNLVHGTLVGQQVDPVRGVANPVVLPHPVIGALPLLPGGHHVVHEERGRLLPYLRQPDLRLPDLLHLQIAPCELSEAAVDVHAVVRAVVLQPGIGLHVLGQLPGSLLIVQAFMEVQAEGRLSLHMTLV